MSGKSTSTEQRESISVKELQAAFEVGRLLNQLQFRSEQVCLNIAESDFRTISDLTAQIRNHLRDIVTPQENRKFNENIDGISRDWEKYRNDESFPQYVFRRFQSYRQYRESATGLTHGENDLDFAIGLTNQLASDSQRVGEYVFKLDRIKASDQLHWAVQLGEAVDQLEHPTLKAGAFIVNPSSTEVENFVGPDGGELPPFKVEPREDWIADQSAEIVRISDRLGLSESDIRSSLPEETGTVDIEAIRSVLAASVNPDTNLSDSEVDETEAGDGRDSETSPTSANPLNELGDRACEELGIEITPPNRTVRAANGQHIPIGPSLRRWELLIYFLNSYGRIIPIEELRGSWSRFTDRRGKQEDGSYAISTVRNGIGNLNEKLRMLNLEIKNYPNLGYQIDKFS